jgi:hypothetical protein
LGVPIDWDTTSVDERFSPLIQSWWPLAKSQTPDITTAGERRFDAFWRTIVTDMNMFCRKAQTDEEGAQFRRWMNKFDASAFDQEDLAIISGVYHFMEFVASFEQVSRNRVFFITEEGYMGMGPRNTKLGDFVCVLLGSRVPFILRAVDDHHVLVGECYCHGIMGGELMHGVDTGKVVLRGFVLR